MMDDLTKRQMNAKTPEEYIKIGMWWTYASTGYGNSFEEMVSMYCHGMDELFVRKFGKLTEKELMNVMDKIFGIEW